MDDLGKVLRTTAPAKSISSEDHSVVLVLWRERELEMETLKVLNYLSDLDKHNRRWERKLIFFFSSSNLCPTKIRITDMNLIFFKCKAVSTPDDCLNYKLCHMFKYLK